MVRSNDEWKLDERGYRSVLWTEGEVEALENGMSAAGAKSNERKGDVVAVTMDHQVERCVAGAVSLRHTH